MFFGRHGHNGISRLYETFGNGGADTEKRILSPEEILAAPGTRGESSAAHRHLVGSATQQLRRIGAADDHFLLLQHTHHFLENYYLKSKRSVEKPTLEGPAAYVLPATQRANRQVELLKVMKRQHVEVQQISESATSNLPPEKRGDKPQAGNIPRREPCHSHGSALLAHRRRAARSAILGARRSAETSLRRHRLVVLASVST